MKKLSGTDFRISPEGVRRMDVPYKRLLESLALDLATLITTPVWAATQTVTLSVPGMACAACPFTVKKALSKVDGVTKAEVSYAKREAIVTFDDTKTSVEAMSKASESAGYPASLKE
jgi:periplasmic mercuric ion binding protein